MGQHTDNADAETSVGGLHRRLGNRLRGPLEAQWDELLDHWATDPSEREAVRAGVVEVRNQVLGTLLDLDQPDELRRGMALQYVEVRCQWALALALIQSQEKRDGRVEERLVYRASCLSLLVQRFEPLVCWEEVDAVASSLRVPVHSQPGE